jgi:thioredoxin 1
LAIDTKTKEWDTLASGKTLVAADFWTPWCPYCRMLKPTFESVAENYPAIKFVKINLDGA